jgi:hypothetical protein
VTVSVTVTQNSRITLLASPALHRSPFYVDPWEKGNFGNWFFEISQKPLKSMV